MEDITIKSVTHCPTCNSECKVNGGTTQYYVPDKKYTEEDLRKAISEAQRSWVVFPNHNSFEDAQVEFMYNAEEIIDLLTH
jgi:phage pi2 protein 07